MRPFSFVKSARRFSSLFAGGLFLFLMLASNAEAQPQNDLWEGYGQGSPSSIGVPPAIGVRAMPVIGNPAFAIFATGLPDQGQVLLLISSSSGEFHVRTIGGDATLLVGAPFQIVRMKREGPGNASLALPIPDDPGLIDTSSYFQCLVCEPGRLSTSAGLQVTFSEAHREFGTVAILSGPPGALKPYYVHRGGTHVELQLPIEIEILPMSLSGFSEAGGLRVDAGDRRVQLHSEDPARPFVALEDVGHLFRFADSSTGQQGFFVARKETAAMVPLMAPSLGNAGIFDPMVGVSGDGRRMVAIRKDPAFLGLGDRVILSTTDGSKLGNGSTFADITPITPLGIDVEILSLSLVSVASIETTILFAARDRSTSTEMVFAGSADSGNPVQAVHLPPLSSGRSPLSIGAPFLQGGELVVLQAGDGTQDDAYAIDLATMQARNVTLFPPFSASVEAFGHASDGTPFHAGLSADGTLLACTALFMGQRDLYLVPTDASFAGHLLGREITQPSWFDPSWTEFRDPYLPTFQDLYFFAGPQPGKLDLFHVDLTLSEDFSPQAVTNVTHTNGQSLPPFSAPGNVDPGLSYVNGRGNVLYFQRGSIGSPLRDLLAVETHTGMIVSVTGFEYTPSPLPSFETLKSITFAERLEERRARQERTVLLMASSSGETLATFDATRFDPVGVRIRHLENGPPGTSFHSVVFSDNFWNTGPSIGFVRSDPFGSEIVATDWNGQLRILHHFDAPIEVHTVDFVHGDDPTFLYTRGVESRDADLGEHWCPRTDEVFPVTTVPGKTLVGVICALPLVNIRVECKYTPDVDVTCFCVDKTSTMTVTLNVETEKDDDIKVEIQGDGPTFDDGTRKKTVKCQKEPKTHTFAIRANAKPGCYSVCVGSSVFANRINVIKATATFRSTDGDSFSDDNDGPKASDSKDDHLGRGTHDYGDGYITNTMELCFALQPMDACGCGFDVKRTRTHKAYTNGNKIGESNNADDDSTNADEDLTPSAKGNIYSYDAPGTDALGGADGDTREQHTHFTEWLEIKNKGKLERCSADILWESHIFIKKTGGTWGMNKAKSDVSTGHDIPLDSQN